MFFKQSVNPLDVLDEMTYIPDLSFTLEEIPLIQNESLNTYFLEYNYISLLEDYNMDLNNKLQLISSYHYLYPEQITLIIDESEYILHPDDFLNQHYFIRPLSQYDSTNQFVLECIDSYLKTNNEDYLDLLLEDEEGPSKVAQTVETVKDKVTDAVPINKNLEKEIKDNSGETKIEAIKTNHIEPTTFVAKKIASLRRVYRVFMVKATQSTDTGIATKLKKIAAKILTYIDKLLAWLQRKTDSTPKASTPVPAK